ncbi:hypothetical protein C2S53_014928 [Perilla frutescens var. hirtella]|uniref:Uncharacterized protein n=1 Tax=Perilla frutescens var. hirtella TaxID=608512 RepID=A0AAD4P9D1_PERFH|nr:hypothetical protein C2S53_014928 [Perilla frutescens var. hirtella]
MSRSFIFIFIFFVTAKLKASSMAASSSTGATAPPPPPPPPPVKEPFLQRFKFYKTLALVVSLTVGVYAFTRTVLKVGPYKEEKPESPTTSTSSSTTPASATAINEQPVTPPTVKPIQRPPVPEDQQRELFKWMLEEKRKAKPRDAEEKKRIDEEKAILKQFIRAKSLPTI